MSPLIEYLRFDINEVNLPVRTEQIRSRLNIYPQMLLSEFILAPLLVMLMWNVVSHDVLLGWLAVAYIAHIAELFFWRHYRSRTRNLAQNLAVDRMFKSLTALAAVIWGSAGVLMFVPGDLAYQALLICVVMGLSA
ncbi:MAG: hypothetical protein V1879_03180, partial [Pseudomonadota bacterium]